MRDVTNPSFVDPAMDSRAITFENPTGGRGAGGTAHGGRKGAPNRLVAPGESVVLADLDGPGTIRHIWMTFPQAPPQDMRALWLEVFYDGAGEPSVSVPALDFFGLPHGRPAEYASALSAAQEGRGYNSYVPMPFQRHLRMEFTNSSTRPVFLYYQLDYTAEPDPDPVYLHVSFRRENPTTMGRDFVIADGLVGPGRFLGCNVGVRVLDVGAWYGEGEVKIYRDGDGDLPTICGTGLEDYVGTAWGLGPHAAPYGGAPVVVAPNLDAVPAGENVPNTDFVGFYRWHLLDPVMFERDLKVAIQQIGAHFFLQGQEAELEAYERDHPVAGAGWYRDVRPPLLAWGIAERVDDYCATAFVYCATAQPVPRLDVAAAIAGIERKPYETVPPRELGALAVAPPD